MSRRATTARKVENRTDDGHIPSPHHTAKGHPSEAVQSPIKPHRVTDYRALLLVFLLAFALRIPGAARPLVGNFATKSAVYGMIARNLAEGRADLLHPMLDVLRGGGRSYHLTELPVSAYLTGGLWKCFGGSLDTWGRATSIAWSMVALAGFYGLLRDWHGESVALAGTFVFALSPVAILYGQSFQLEASVLALTVLTVWSTDRWLQQDRPRWLVAAIISAMLLLLTKIYMVYLVLPLFYLAWRRRGLRVFRSPLVWSALVVATLPAALWYGHVFFGANGDFGFDPQRVYYSARQSVDAHGFPHPLLLNPEFYKHLLDDLTGVVLTPLGFALALVGACSGLKRRYGFWLAGCGLLVLLLPRKFYEMNYYWTAVLPPLCALAGIGLAKLYKGLALPRSGTILAAAVWLILSLRLVVTPAFSTPPSDTGVVAAGTAVERLSLPEQRVLTLHGSSLDLLYYCNRAGWVFPVKNSATAVEAIETYRRQGAAYFVVADLEQLDRIAGLRSATAMLPVAAQGPDYIVYRLPSDGNDS